ncbi:MAG: beta-propeller domain-containing protein [Candidatus Micrarchaeota archaeon]|nr:beta-propeller domain-containing protein [Candidatus Micrarchaeota archaeon]
MENSGVFITAVICFAIGAAAMYAIAAYALPQPVVPTASPTPVVSPTPFATAQPLQVGVGKFSSQQEFADYVSKGREQGGYGYDVFSMLRGVVMETGVAPVAAPFAATSGEKAAAERVSETNVQVAGIDEPDILKTDGTNLYFSPESYYRYYYYGPGGKTKIIKAFPPAELAEKPGINSSGNLLLDKERKILVVLGNEAIEGYSTNQEAGTAEKKWEVKLEETEVVDARYSAGTVYVVLRKSLPGYAPCPIPLYSVGGVTKEIACTDVWRPVSPLPVDVTYHVLAISTADGTVSSKVSFVGSSDASEVYVSPESIYVAYRRQLSTGTVLPEFYLADAVSLLPAEALGKIAKIGSYDISGESKANEIQLVVEQFLSTLSKDERLRVETELNNKMQSFLERKQRDLERTEIVKVSIPSLEVKATGAIPGRLLNQFALDEYSGYLRAATTTGRWDKSVNDVYVLDSSLKTVGSVLNLGKTERIYSVRFMGDRGYVVTYRETDPFYVLDLSNPSQPLPRGELKIPGFSSYLHPLAEHVILGVGREDQNVKLSVFDVSDPANPAEVSKYMLSEYWTSVSETHHAFLLDDKHKVFFIPAGSGGYVISYDPDAGYALSLKAVTAVDNALRAAYLDDYLYIVSAQKIVVLDENTWQKIGETDLSSDPVPSFRGPMIE